MWFLTRMSLKWNVTPVMIKSPILLFITDFKSMEEQRYLKLSNIRVLKLLLAMLPCRSSGSAREKWIKGRSTGKTRNKSQTDIIPTRDVRRGFLNN